MSGRDAVFVSLALVGFSVAGALGYDGAAYWCCGVVSGIGVSNLLRARRTKDDPS